MITKRDLSSDYALMRARIEEEIKRLRAESKQRLKDEISAVRKEHKTAFAVQLNRARDEGMKRDDILDVLGTRDGNTLKEFVELGGGTMRKLRSATERVEQREAEQEESRKAKLTKFGVQYVGWIESHPKERPGEFHHHFSIDEMAGGEFYTVSDFALPIGENQGEAMAWLQAHRDVVTELHELYPAEEA